jgi:hypothetical protein
MNLTTRPAAKPARQRLGSIVVNGNGSSRVVKWIDARRHNQSVSNRLSRNAVPVFCLTEVRGAAKTKMRRQIVAAFSPLRPPCKADT